MGIAPEQERILSLHILPKINVQYLARADPGVWSTDIGQIYNLKILFVARRRQKFFVRH